MKAHTAAILVVLLTLIGAQRAESQSVPEIDHSGRWKRHLIDAKVFRDHGHSVEVADLNGDGRPDALIAFGARRLARPADGVYWYEAPKDARSGRWVRRRLTAPALPIRWCMAVAVGDMDNDGDLDVVALSFNEASVYLAINPLKQGGDINRPWRTVKILDSSHGGRDGERIELVDIDGDGFRDVVFPRGAPAEVHVLFNPSGKLAGKWQDKIVGGHGGSDAHGILCADLDLDGDLDLVAASGDGSRSGKVYWYEHPGNDPRGGKWRRHQASRYEMNYGALQIDDVDQDGRPDILVTEAHLTPGKMMWFKNPQPSRGGWRRFVIGTQTFPHEALSLDIDGDGHKEYWVGDASHDRSGGFGHRNGGIVYFHMTDDPTRPWTKIRVAAAPEVGRQCRAVDIDGDGDLDIVSTADHFQDKHTISVVWWENKTPQARSQDKSARGHAEAAQEKKSPHTVIFADNFDRQPEGWTNAKGQVATDMLHGEQFGNWETVHIAKGHAEISASHRHGKTGKGFRFKVVKSSGVTQG